jgi:hypothetical protein
MKFTIFILVLIISLTVVSGVQNNKGKGGQGGQGKPNKGGKGNETDDGCGNKPKDICEKQKERKKEFENRKAEAKKKFMTRKKASERDNNVGDSTLRVDKDGAEIEILREGQVLEFKMKEIKEKIANKTEPTKYNLRNTVFNVTKNGQDNTRYNVTAGVIILTGRLDNGAIIKFYVYMFNTSANITGEDGNEYELVAGGVKANFELEWPNEVEYLEVKLAVKCGFEGNKGKKPTKGKENRGMKGKGNKRGPSTYSVCPNARMTFSPSYISNGTRQDMPNDFPKPEDVSKDNEALVSLKFNGVKKVFYDPTAEGGDDIGDDPLALTTPSTAFISAKPNFLLTIFFAAVFSLAKIFM